MKLFETFLATVLMFIWLLLVISSCKNDIIVNESSTHHIILAFDGFGTNKVDSWVWSSERFYQQYIDYLETGGGVLVLYNFADSIPNPISLHVKSQYALPSVYMGESRIEPVKILNDSIRLLNERQKSTFWKILDARESNFDPGNGLKSSYVEANLLAILESLKLPQYQSHSANLLLYSDLINCPLGETAVVVKEEVVVQIIETNAKIALCSFTQNQATKLIQSGQILSPKDFLGIIQSQKP